MKKKRTGGETASGKDEAVLLEDLAPRGEDDVRGGSGKIRFGQDRVSRPSPSDDRPTRKGVKK